MTTIHDFAEPNQMDDYYPFGLTFNSYTRPSAKKNDFLYNGKEVQDELDLNWMPACRNFSEGRDYGARMYDAAIGRFMVNDRFAEKYVDFTPYQYGANNPIKYIDINGDSLDVATNQDSRDDIDGLVKEKNRGYISYDENSLSLDFGDMSDEDKAKTIKKDKGLSLLNDLASADEKYSYAATNKHGEGLEYSDSKDGKGTKFSSSLLKSLNTEKFAGQTIGMGDDQFAWFTNSSTNPRGDEEKIGSPYIRPTSESGYNAIITISPGTVIGSNGQNASRSGYVRHELKEAYLRTSEGMTYKKAHRSAGNPRTFSKFSYKKK